MKLIKVTRVLEYVGPKDRIEKTLENSLVTEEEPLWQCRGVVIQQVSLTKEEVDETSPN